MEREGGRKKKQALKKTPKKKKYKHDLRHEWIERVTEIYMKRQTDKEQKRQLHNATCY